MIIPTYNRADLLERAVKSIFRQGYPSIEIIIIDDKSTDDTKAVVKSLQDKYTSVNYRLNCRTKGPSGARNTGILMATGDWVAFLDSDDEWKSNHLADGLACLGSHRTASVLFGNFKVVDAKSGMHLYDFFDKKIVLKKLRKKNFKNGIWLIEDNILEALVQENFFHLGSSLVRREVVNGILFDEKVRFAEDRDFAIRLYKEARVDFICRLSPTFIQYRHSKNLAEFSNTEVLLEDYQAQLHLFKKYLKNYDLSVSEKSTVLEAIRQTLVKSSYRCRQKYQWHASWNYLSESFRYGASSRQIKECIKLIISFFIGPRRKEKPL